jgi:cellulose synthase/poly-beta-1,6-N-acetylglucosamine synthase-like glycosyltransferase
MREPRRAPGFYTLTLLHVGCLALFYAALWQAWLVEYQGPGRRLWWLKAALEILASFYCFSTVLKSLNYLLSPRSARSSAPEGSPRSWPPIACIYLCAGDLDRRALESICRLEYPGRLHVYVHDDSGDPRVAERVDDLTRELLSSTGRPVFALRRRHRTGGKPGAVNYVLSCLGNRYPFILFADNDSTAVDPRVLARTLPLLEDPRVAAVQFRNVGVAAQGEGPINGLLRRAIDVFDLFAVHQSRFGMALFLGHNALLRTAALNDAGGLREGVFSDDVDLSVRLVRLGWRILYAPDIPFGETHPISYASFRRRAYKWAFGCGQVLRNHLVQVLLDRRLTFAQKFGFLEFTGFYAMQTVLILYLILVGLVLPVLSGPVPGQAPALFLSGLAIIISIFLPSFAYHARHGRLSEWWPFALVCAMVYGSVAFTSARGLIDGILGRRRRWVPTNLDPGARRSGPALASESLFGLLLFLVPALFCPAVLWQPSMYLFATVFLLSPWMGLTYVPSSLPDRPRGNGIIPPPGSASSGSGRLLGRPVIWIPLATLAVLVFVLMTIRWAGASGPQAARVAIEGDSILLDGRPFLVRGIHYSPWPPGTGPTKDYAWPDERAVARDLATIQALGANTILVHDAPPSIFPQAGRRGLMVIESFYINWQSIGDDALFEARAAEIVRSAEEIGGEPNLLAILLGNEVLEWVLRERGAPYIEGRLRLLYDEVKRVAPHVPVSHANWPVTRQLDLAFMDMACFNLYPSWPREVIVAGYGNYIENVLKPIAAGRPLLITEFGQNSLEASEEKQARVLRESWDEIRARTAGGVVFEYADEWWKNYDNPIRAGEWWQREYAPDDEATHDLDPEEYYGIMTSDRNPKPAFETVRLMFSPRFPALRGVLLSALPLLLLFGYTIYIFRRHR